jgi:hypothetical protein
MPTNRRPAAKKPVVKAPLPAMPTAGLPSVVSQLMAPRAPAPTAANPDAPVVMPTPWGTFRVPSYAEQAALMQRGADQATVSPYAQELARLRGAATPQATMPAPPEQVYTPLVAEAPVDPVQMPDMPGRGSTMPSIGTLAGSLLAGLLTGQGGVALGMAAQRGQADAEQRYQDSLARWEQSVRQAQMDHDAAVAARAERMGLAQQNANGLDRVTNANALAGFNRDAAETEAGNTLAATQNQLAGLGDLDQAWQRWAGAQAGADAANTTVASMRAGRNAEVEAGNKAQMGAQRLAPSILNYMGGQDRLTLAYKRLGLDESRLAQTQEYQAGMLEARRAALAARQKAQTERGSGGHGNRRDENIRFLESVYHQASNAAANAEEALQQFLADPNAEMMDKQQYAKVLSTLQGRQKQTTTELTNATKEYRIAASGADPTPAQTKPPAGTTAPRSGAPPPGARVFKYDINTGRLN